MILVDTSVWIDHLRRGDLQLVDLLNRRRVLIHPFVIGELACGSLVEREAVLALLQDLPQSTVAENQEVLGFITQHRLHGEGIGFIDMHLLASAALSDGARIWTRDKKLHAVAQELNVADPDTGAHCHA